MYGEAAQRVGEYGAAYFSGLRTQKSPQPEMGCGLICKLATTYSPTGSPRQYHPRGRA